jgi:hypothetical protein
MPLTIGFALALSAALSTPAAPEPAAVPAQAQTVQEYVAEYFADAPIMVSIAKCESHFRQYDRNGAVYRGVVNNKDVGVMQVNEYYHAEAAKKLNLNLWTLEGNTAYARYLYEKEGTTPWLSSSACWNKSKHIELARAR